MKILSNKKYNDLISKQFRGIFADVNDDNLLRENGLLYGENKELQKENKQLKYNWDKLKEWLESNWEESQDIRFVKIINKMQELEQGSDKE